MPFFDDPNEFLLHVLARNELDKAKAIHGATASYYL